MSSVRVKLGNPEQAQGPRHKAQGKTLTTKDTKGHKGNSGTTRVEAEIGREVLRRIRGMRMTVSELTQIVAAERIEVNKFISSHTMNLYQV